MIFPNRAPDPELRPGMGYAGGSHSLLGYEPGADALGYVAARMGYAAEMGYHAGAALGYHAGAALGDFSASMENAAIDAGIAPNDIDLLNSVGATDADLSNLINGNITLSQLYANYGVTLPSSTLTTGVPGSAAATGSTPVVTPISTSPAQSPPGSTLLYTATYGAVKNWTTASSAIQALAPLLPSHGMSLQSSQVSASGIMSNASFSVTVLDSVGHALISDAKSVLDALMNQISGNQLQSSTLTMVAPGMTASGASASATTPSTDPVSWLENNAIYIGGAVLALVLVNNFTGGKRR
jgi:hypothetical protein